MIEIKLNKSDSSIDVKNNKIIEFVIVQDSIKYTSKKYDIKYIDNKYYLCIKK